MASSIPAAPHVFGANEFATSPNLDTLTTNINFLLGLPYTFAYATTTTSVLAAGGASNAIPLDSETEDSDNMHVVTGGSNAFFTFNTPGVWHLEGQVLFPATASGSDNVTITRSSSPTALYTGVLAGLNIPSIAGTHRIRVSADIRIGIGDVVQLNAGSVVGCTTSVAAQNGSYMSARWVRL